MVERQHFQWFISVLQYSVCLVAFSAVQEAKPNQEFTTIGYKTDRLHSQDFFFSTPIHRISSSNMRWTSHGALVGKSQKRSRNTQTTECVTADGTFDNHMFSFAWNPQPRSQRVNTDLVSVATMNVWWHHRFNFSSSPASKVGHMTN